MTETERDEEGGREGGGKRSRKGEGEGERGIERLCLEEKQCHLLSSVCGAARMALCFFFTSSTFEAIFSIICRISSTCKTTTVSVRNVA